MATHNPRPGEMVDLSFVGETRVETYRIAVDLGGRKYNGHIDIFRLRDGTFDGYEYHPDDGTADISDNEEDLRVVLDCIESEE